MPRLLLLYTAFIIYGSLYPFQFHDPHLAASPLWHLLHSWSVRMDRFTARDALVNLVLYVPFGTAAFLSFRRRSRLAAAGVVAAGAALSGCIEMAQLFDLHRTCSTADLVCNMAGTAAGVALGASLSAPRFRRLAGLGDLRLSAPLVLFVVWAGYQTFPMFPNLGHTRLAASLRFLASPAHFSWIELALSCAEWLAVAALLETVAGPRLARKLLPCLWLAVVLRLIIVGRHVSLAEAAAAVLGWAAWRWGLTRLDQRALAAAALLLAAVVVRGLAPFQFTPRAGVFHWVPFTASLEGENFDSAMVLMRKAFDYGAVVWLMAGSGAGLAVAAATTAAVLGSVEVAQLYLPPHTAEITDPLLAVLMAVVLRTAGRRYRAAPLAPSTTFSPVRQQR